MKVFLALFLTFVFSIPFWPALNGSKVTITQQIGEELHEVSVVFQMLQEEKLCRDFHFTFPGCDTITEQDSLNENYVIQDAALIKCYHLNVLLQPPNA